MRAQISVWVVGMAFWAAVVALSAGSAGAAETKPGKGWGTSSDYEKALKIAKEKNLPVAVMWAARESECPKHNGMASAVMSSRSLEGAVRVLMYTDEKSTPVNEWRRQANGSNIIPYVFFLDPQGRLTSFVDYERRNELKAEASKVAELMAWQSKATKQLAKADAAAAAGRFAAAMKLVHEVAEQDAAATQAVEHGLTHPGEALPAASKSSSSSKNKSKTAAKADADESPAADAKPAGRYFPELVSTKREAYAKLAEERLGKAKELAEAKDAAAAMKLLMPMVSTDKKDADFAAEFDSLKEAAELMTELKSAAKSSPKPAAKTGAKAAAKPKA